jgi:hypothetical protein
MSIESSNVTFSHIAEFLPQDIWTNILLQLDSDPLKQGGSLYLLLQLNKAMFNLVMQHPAIQLIIKEKFKKYTVDNISMWTSFMRFNLDYIKGINKRKINRDTYKTFGNNVSCLVLEFRNLVPIYLTSRKIRFQKQDELLMCPELNSIFGNNYLDLIRLYETSLYVFDLVIKEIQEDNIEASKRGRAKRLSEHHTRLLFGLPILNFGFLFYHLILSFFSDEAFKYPSGVNFKSTDILYFGLAFLVFPIYIRAIYKTLETHLYFHNRLKELWEIREEYHWRFDEFKGHFERLFAFHHAFPVDVPLCICEAGEPETFDLESDTYFLTKIISKTDNSISFKLYFYEHQTNKLNNVFLSDELNVALQEKLGFQRPIEASLMQEIKALLHLDQQELQEKLKHRDELVYLFMGEKFKDSNSTAIINIQNKIKQYPDMTSQKLFELMQTEINQRVGSKFSFLTHFKESNRDTSVQKLYNLVNGGQFGLKKLDLINSREDRKKLIEFIRDEKSFVENHSKLALMNNSFRFGAMSLA